MQQASRRRVRAVATLEKQTHAPVVGLGEGYWCRVCVDLIVGRAGVLARIQACQRANGNQHGDVACVEFQT